MPDSTRRGFIIMAGAGAAAVGAVAAASDASASPALARTPDVSAATGEGSLIAYVRDVRKGEVSVLVGEREVVIQDHALVAKLARAAS
jgi:hypothetical protein